MTGSPKCLLLSCREASHYTFRYLRFSSSSMDSNINRSYQKQSFATQITGSSTTNDCSNRKIPHVLTVAGSDSGAGAGIQADLKTCAARGVYCSTVITAVTAQNTVGVQGINALPAEFVAEQLKSVLSDMQVDVVKTGMLPSINIIKVLNQNLIKFPVRALVVDPVMVSTSGDVLADPSILSGFCFVQTIRISNLLASSGKGNLILNDSHRECSEEQILLRAYFINYM
ncbi:thiamine biosynthetic bifunctional enzyme TH1, chloroplastic-like isoform X2 [Carica papaya]|uniref:thiamine biosynthetic bifunctional enzyme TH1, chloroplastic-like isoform X2 n=1 Tax=Carica papaya TaxID=3649 RepID=UPI000B8D0290|nr:thiamine biosynthetic bifunctional enzyme TH1, chloroplastic-like isoform X2 [Carica papaya]